MINPYTIEVIKRNWQHILGPDKKNGAICPLCGSGKGKHGTGVSSVKGSTVLKCFACGESGDVIRFISKKFGWDDSNPNDFIKAVEFCANSLGIKLDHNDHFNISSVPDSCYLRAANLFMPDEIKKLKPDHIDIKKIAPDTSSFKPVKDVDKFMSDAFQMQIDRIHNTRSLFGDENYDIPEDDSIFSNQEDTVDFPDASKPVDDTGRNPFDHVIITPFVDIDDGINLDENFDKDIVRSFDKNFCIWHAHINSTNYWAKRGLSLDTVNHFNCGFAADWIHPNWKNAFPSPRFIIPVGPVGYLARDTRPFDSLNDFCKDKCKVKCGSMQIFHRQAFNSNILFIVEGEIDAMSIFEVGFHNVCALGSIGYIDLFFSELQADYVNGVIKHFPNAAIVALDNEDKDQVKRAKAELIARLNSLGIVAIDGSSISGNCKDPNDLLVADRDQLKLNCHKLMDAADQAELPYNTRIIIPQTREQFCQQQSQREYFENATEDTHFDAEDFRAEHQDYTFEDDNDCIDRDDTYSFDPQSFAATESDPSPSKPPIADNPAFKNALDSIDNTNVKLNKKKSDAKSQDKDSVIARRKAEKYKKELEKAEKKAAKADKKPDKAAATLVLSGTDSTQRILPSCPIDLNIPENYKVSDDGIIEKGTTIAARNVIVPVAKIINHHSREQKYEVAINDADGNWENLIVEALTLADKTKIIELANRGLHIYAGDSAAATVRYLFELIAMNEGNIPVREEFDQPGWSSDFRQFRMPWTKDFYMPDLENIYTINGLHDAWLEKAQELCQNPVARLMLGTSFCAPLLRLIGQRSFGVYLYGNSKAGKSAIQKFAISAFGNPNKMMGTFNATMNGIEALCSRSNDLPLLIDESTVAGRNIDEEKLGYIFTGEQSKIRMTRTLSQRPVKKWRLPLLLNGEGRLFDDATKEGAMNRMLEFALGPDERLFKDEMSARLVHKFVDYHHGKVGLAFIKALRMTAKDDAKNPAMSSGDFDFSFVTELFDSIFVKARESFYPKFTLEQLALMSSIATGYELYQSIFRNIPLDELDQRSMEDIFDPNIIRLPTAVDLREDGRAWRIFVEHLQSRRSQFMGQHHYKLDKVVLPFGSPTLGEFRFAEEYIDTQDDLPDETTAKKLELDEVLVLPTMAKEILADHGFSPNKLLRAFEHNGWCQRKKLRWAGNKSNSQHMIVIPANHFTPDTDLFQK